MVASFRSWNRQDYALGYISMARNSGAHPGSSPAAQRAVTDSFPNWHACGHIGDRYRAEICSRSPSGRCGHPVGNEHRRGAHRGAREHLANFKVPHTVEIRTALPKNRVGKIDKELLKQEVLA